MPRSEAWARTGKPPITVRWIDTNKGDDDTPNIRCRLVAREIRKAGEDPIFAPTPPLESLRTIISLAAIDFHGAAKKNRDPNSPDRIQVSFIDISRAYFCAATDPDEPTYVELPAEDPDHKVLVRWTDNGLEYEADPRQCEKLLRDLKLDGDDVKSVGTPGVKPTRDQLDGDAPLHVTKCTPYRAVVARANYLASDRPELQFPAKEVCRWMSSPTELALSALKRLGRYVVGHRRLVFHYPWQTVNRVDTYSDTDWAGCAKTRKSTSGGCLLPGSHLIKSWSSTQTSVSLSSGES